MKKPRRLYGINICVQAELYCVCNSMYDFHLYVRSYELCVPT